MNLTQAQLAIRLGVSLKTVSNYEKGEVIPDSKKALLYSIFNENELNEPQTTYYKKESVEENVNQVSTLYKEAKTNAKLAHKHGEFKKEEYYKALTNIYKDRLSLLTEASASKIEEDDY